MANVKFYGIPNPDGSLRLSPEQKIISWEDDTRVGVELSAEPFEGSVIIKDYYSGRSAAGLTVIINDHPSGDLIYAKMSTKHVVEMLNHPELVVEQDWDGKPLFHNLFKFTKKGTAVFVEVA